MSVSICSIAIDYTTSGMMSGLVSGWLTTSGMMSGLVSAVVTFVMAVDLALEGLKIKETHLDKVNATTSVAVL